MSVYFIGCLHLAHKNIAENLRGMSVKDHDERILEGLSALTKRDKVFILGDLTMETAKGYYELGKLRCVTHVVLGNHDRYQDVKCLLDNVDQVSGCLNYKSSILTHMPVHPQCLGDRYEINIHAHVHDYDVVLTRGETEDTTVYDHRYINVDAHRLNYKPISWDEIMSR